MYNDVIRTSNKQWPVRDDDFSLSLALCSHVSNWTVMPKALMTALSLTRARDDFTLCVCVCASLVHKSSLTPYVFNLLGQIASRLWDPPSLWRVLWENKESSLSLCDGNNSTGCRCDQTLIWKYIRENGMRCSHNLIIKTYLCVYETLTVILQVQTFTHSKVKKKFVKQFVNNYKFL